MPFETADDLRAKLRKSPLDADALRSLSERLADPRGVHSSEVARQTRLSQADTALRRGDLETAEILLRQHLLEAPSDVEAVRLLADLARQLGLPEDSERLLRYAVELAPEHSGARLALAGMVLRQGRFEQGIGLIDELLRENRVPAEALRMKASALYQAGQFDDAEQLYRQVLEAEPRQAGVWVSYGRLLKAVGRSEESAVAFKKASEIEPTSGVAWWSLSDLKSARLGQSDVAAMRSVLSGSLSKEDRFHILFALGKALEDCGEDEEAFASYAQANAIRRSILDYRPQALTDFVRTAQQLFNAEFFADRQSGGCLYPDPIFIVGVTRSGSTLIEQILSSHSLVEGTLELPDLPEIARSVAANMQEYLVGVSNLGEERRRQLGAAYLQRIQGRRHTGKPYFTDKMPLNWMHIPLIKLILPRARIIDARRHPLGCGWSNFKQHYATGQAFTYNLDEFGLYYRDYVRLMAHMDEVLPGLVHRVFHERMVEQPEAEIRRLLEFLDLPFEQSCLEFHKTKRAVMTPSAEQVRRPINRAGVDQWRRFEEWLEPLKEALGPVLTSYPDVPAEFH